MTDAVQRGRFAAPVRRGEAVDRAAGPGAVDIHALLTHLHDHGFDLSPQVLEVSDDGARETLSFLPGDTGYPPLAAALRLEQALTGVAGAVPAAARRDAGLRGSGAGPVERPRLRRPGRA
ncbi:Transposase for insertion sequence element IS21 [Actinoplanes sp. SE50]|uniref:hypothetical protein n=1 Tax=unclassified Actinoplanes TaxID=2626549 RepID=UPI00023ED4C9|nr:MULTISPECIES: hypothetical protein [unclassified Actinoplanes]AEV86759.1 Trifolitoxin immunity protein [Actinoplanes sp. SE50/110]ATO85156.1 Transposase for insertion sequence element IS21 [Actinoplanes sp. SE50]SLM02567.1 Trifolitoxin immunity protein [Actinoplanes sp. SE50/110]